MHFLKLSFLWLWFCLFNATSSFFKTVFNPVRVAPFLIFLSKTVDSSSRNTEGGNVRRYAAGAFFISIGEESVLVFYSFKKAISEENFLLLIETRLLPDLMLDDLKSLLIIR